ncbi:hypothetical protein ACRAWF_14510 [Streptomyces sp. L7]
MAYDGTAMLGRQLRRCGDNHRRAKVSSRRPRRPPCCCSLGYVFGSALAKPGDAYRLHTCVAVGTLDATAESGIHDGDVPGQPRTRHRVV